MESLLQIVRETPADDMATENRIAMAQRRAGAAITLLRQGERESIFDALRFTTDPEALSQFVARCKQREVTASELIKGLDRCDVARTRATGAARKVEDRVLFGLLLALGDYSPDQLPRCLSTGFDPTTDYLVCDRPQFGNSRSNWLAAATLEQACRGYPD